MEPRKEQRKTLMRWQDIHVMVNNLHRLMVASGWLSSAELIVPVARGGLIPGAMMAYKTGLAQTPIRVATLSGSAVGEVASTIQCSRDVLEGIRCLGDRAIIIDELVDSGSTFAALRKELPEARFACLLTKKPSADHMYAADWEGTDDWLIFPWEEDPWHIPSRGER